MNKDINSILMSPKSILKSPTSKVSSRGGSSGRKSEKGRLPKLNLRGILSGKKISFQDKAVDSNRAIAFAYYTRRLMLVGWRSFFNYRLEKANKRFFDRICRQKKVKSLKKKAFKALFFYLK